MLFRSLDMSALCLGGRLDKFGVAALQSLPLPALKRMSFRNLKGCPLTAWVLGWRMGECSTINFCSSYIDEAVVELLLPFRNRHERLNIGLHNTTACGGCELELELHGILVNKAHATLQYTML